MVQWWHFQLGLLNIFVISKRLWQIYEKTINKFKPYAICFLVLYLFTRIELFFNDGFLPYDWQMENQSIEPTWWWSFSPPAINKRYIKKSENQIHLLSTLQYSISLVCNQHIFPFNYFALAYHKWFLIFPIFICSWPARYGSLISFCMYFPIILFINIFSKYFISLQC